jgi:hypothetical protein
MFFFFFFGGGGGGPLDVHSLFFKLPNSLAKRECALADLFSMFKLAHLIQAYAQSQIIEWARTWCRGLFIGYVVELDSG